MNSKSLASLAATGLMLASFQANAVTITFEDLATGAVLSNQYAALGAVFSPNAFTGANSNSTPQPWSTVTDMTIVSSTSPTDAGALGLPLGVVSGNILRSLNGWANDENGDPSFLISFTNPVNTFSAAFAGVSFPSDTQIFVYNGATLLGTVAGATDGQFVLSFAAPSITSVAVAAGSFGDWVGVDNITYTVAVVPEPSTYGLLALGLGLLAYRRRVR